MHDLILFLGRFHVLALHLPIGIVLVAVFLDWVARKDRYRTLAVAAPFLWGAAAVSAVLTVALGYMHFAEGAFTGPSALAHRFFGTGVAVVTSAIWGLTRRPELHRRLSIATGIVAIALVSITGHFGGDLTHGSTFLWEFAPGPLRTLAGVASSHEKPTSVASADPFRDVVQPLLARRCGGCHNGDKRKGGFSMATYESILAGGENGHVLVAGKSDSSELFKRISLPHDDKDFMPAEGKTPLSDPQVKIVGWWIDVGMPHGTTMDKLSVDGSVETLVAAELGLAGVQPTVVAAAAVAADPSVVDRLYQSGFLVRQVSQSDPHLIVSEYSPGARVTAEQISTLLSVANQIVEVNLQNAGLDDELLAKIASLSEVKRLRLSHNKITDLTVATFKSMPKLERLNLYANPGITDASVAVLGSLPALNRLDVWQTSISAGGIARLRALRPELEVQGGAVPMAKDAGSATAATGH